MSLKNIIAHLDKNGFLVVSKLPCVSHGENEAVGINVSTPDDFLSQMPDDTNWYFEFESADGQKQVCGPVTPQNGLLTCNVTNSVLCCPGEARVQIVATDQNSDYIFKSSIATFFVSQSINATDKSFVRDDLLAKIDKLIAGMDGTSQNGNGGQAGSINYLVNSNFAINQRGQSVYDTQGQGRTYTVDRWAKNSDTGNLAVTPLQNGVQVHGLPSGTGELFVQPVEPSVVDGKKVTLSAKAKTVSGACCLGIVAHSGTSAGKPVPNDGSFVDMVYFNTAIKEEEFAVIASQLDFVEGFSTFPIYPILITQTGDALCVLNNTTLGRYFIGIQNTITGAETNIFVPTDIANPAIWHIDSCSLGANSVSVVQGLAVGTQNDLLASVVSVEDFDSGRVETKAFVSLKEGTNSVTADIPVETKSVVCGIFGDESGAKGTPLPTDGTVVQKICFNTDATVDEVVAVASQIVPQSNTINYLFVDTSDTIRLCLENQNGTFLIKDEKSGSIYFSSDSGWQSGTQNGITVGKGGLSFVDVDGLSVPVGQFNDLLADVVYGMGKTDLSFELEWAKLEVGKRATEYLAPQPALEMVACQRYYQKFSCNNLVGYAKNSSAINLALPLTNSMRKNPTLEGDNVAGFFGTVGNTTPSLVCIDDNVAQLSFATQNATEGNVYVVQNYHGALDDEIY